MTCPAATADSASCKCNASMPQTLKDITKSAILEMVRSVNPGTDRWKVLVVDQLTVKILSSACTLSDVTDEQVMIIESLEKDRQPMPDTDVLYFLQPTAQSVDKMLEDFSSKPKYAGVHIFFTSRVPDDLISKMKRSVQFISRVRALREVQLEFLSHESQVFLLNMPGSFRDLYASSPGAAPGTPPPHGMLNAVWEDIALRLTTAMITMNEFPTIRHMKGNQNSMSVATKVYDKLRDHKTTAPGWSPNSDSPATLVIVDRPYDALAPLMHEYTYQAMVYDTLTIANDVYQHEATLADGKKETKSVLLNENDTVWADNRNLFISDAVEKITADFREFQTKNKMAGMAKGGEVSLAEMSEALRSMPQFKTQVSQMSLHLAMCGRCFELQPNQEVGMLEQNMAMGEDENGKTFSDAVNSIMKVYRTPPDRFNDDQKLRLLLICCISQNGLSESERTKLFKMSGLDQGRDNQMIMTNLSNLGIQLQKQKARIFQRSKKPERRKVGGSAAPDWALFRFRPSNYFICQDVIDNKLSVEEYPIINQATSGSASGGGAAAVGQSARRPKPAWNLSGMGAKKDEKTFVGARVIFFVIGGMTYSEVRSAYELTKSNNREVLVGSTHLYTPKEFLRSLAALSS